MHDLQALTRLDTFLLDLDGTVYLGSNAIPGAAQCISYLRDAGLQLLFFTNNSTRDAALYAEKLLGLGIPAGPEEILTSGEATVRYLLTQTPYRRVYAVGTPPFERELLNAGFELDNQQPQAVVLAYDRTITYAKLETAALLLQDGLPYFATNPDWVCPTERGPIPDCGSMAALLEKATGRLPQFIGKPHRHMIDMALDKLQASPETTAMVGDRLYTDMQMAYDSGITSVLVLSGETQKADLDAADRRPDFVFASLAELHTVLRDSGGMSR
jgi:HAD superfamily hydrolase (TIGR01457 family)